jgi:hypothetical protein
MFNIVGKKQKALYQRELTRIMIALERKFSKKIKPIIGRQYLDTAKLVESGVVDIDQAVNDQSSRLADTLKKQYYTTATLFSDEVFNAFEETQKGIEIPQTKGMREDFWTTMISWIKIHGAKKVVQVDDTTKESMRTVILKGVSEGKSYKKIATDLRIIKESASRVRSMRIARTEVHTSAMKSIHTAVISTGVKSEKEWIATIDERTRGINIKDKFNHVRANGERVKDDEKFVKTGEPLDYPGDPEGSAANIINCRCVSLFHIIRSPVKR